MGKVFIVVLNSSSKAERKGRGVKHGAHFETVSLLVLQSFVHAKSERMKKEL